MLHLQVPLSQPIDRVIASFDIPILVQRCAVVARVEFNNVLQTEVPSNVESLRFLCRLAVPSGDQCLEGDVLALGHRLRARLIQPMDLVNDRVRIAFVSVCILEMPIKSVLWIEIVGASDKGER